MGSGGGETAAAQISPKYANTPDKVTTDTAVVITIPADAR